MRIAPERFGDAGQQEARLFDDRLLCDALRTALKVGLHDDGIVEGRRRPGGEIIHEGPARRWHTHMGAGQLGEALVERQRADMCIGAREGDAELREEARVEAHAEALVAPLCDVEDHVGVERLEARDEARGRAADLHRLDIMAEPPERLGERLDGLGMVELRLFFRGLYLQVVG